MALHFISINDNVKGKRNNKNPVILFITVCRDKLAMDIAKVFGVNVEEVFFFSEDNEDEE